LEFLQAPGGHQLVVPANLSSVRSIKAQHRLAARIRDDSRDVAFVSAYGEKATRNAKRDRSGFRIHSLKMQPELKDALQDTHLAWKPDTFEPYDHSCEYAEVHPRLGEAIMSTLAVACAIGEGLDVVADPQSEPLHACVINKDESKIYDAWLHDAAVDEPETVDSRDLFEWIVRFNCNVQAVTPTMLIALDREPLQKLIQRLREHASGIPAMDRSALRDEYLADCVSKVLQEWERDRRNLGSFWREFFGEKAIDVVEKFTQQIAEKAVTPASAGAAISGVNSAAKGSVIVSGAMHGALYGAGLGVAIGAVFHGIKSYSRMEVRAQESPYRYLTILEDAGVEFRTDSARRPGDVLQLNA
jgi:hypothetical protein